MSAIQTVAITLVYLLPVALIALLLATQSRPHGRWLLTTVLLVLPLFYIGHYLLLQGMQGWPSNMALPQQFQLLAFDISEPDPNTYEPGQILLWTHTGDSEQPRVHRLAYRKGLHRELVAAGQRQAQGRPQTGIRSPPPASDTTAPGTDRQEIIRFKDTANRTLPSKH